MEKQGRHIGVEGPGESDLVPLPVGASPWVCQGESSPKEITITVLCILPLNNLSFHIIITNFSCDHQCD